MAKVSILVPALDEEAVLLPTLERLQPMRARGCEVILVDGGSRDATKQVARPWVDLLLDAPRGRARQMNAGAQRARGDLLWFLHADTLAPAEGDLAVIKASEEGHTWGRFDVRLTGRNVGLRIIEWMMNKRSCLTGISTGDQGIFVSAAAFSEAGAYPNIDLMEDIALSATLKRRQRPACLRQRITVSSRRWERGGIWRTVLTMWRVRAGYWLGQSPDILVRIYYGRRD
jgi:rSAM/selenodomain-associated transferase 2